VSCGCYLKQVFLFKNYSVLLGLQPSLLLKRLYIEKSQEMFIKNIRVLGQDLFVTYIITNNLKQSYKSRNIFSLKKTKTQKPKLFTAFHKRI